MIEEKKQVILVDENDQPVGTTEKLVAHEQALCHRAFSIFIFKQTDEGEALLLQKRHDDKYHCGGLWTNTCCSHPSPGETLNEATKRRLKEELGLQLELHYVDWFHYIARFSNGLTENEIDHVFWGEYDGTHIEPNEEEIAEIKWYPLSQLQNLLDTESEQFTPWFKQALDMAMKKEKNTCAY